MIVQYAQSGTLSRATIPLALSLDGVPLSGRLLRVVLDGLGLVWLFGFVPLLSFWCLIVSICVCPFRSDLSLFAPCLGFA